ncbi:GNAT family N-acetyltransferase [Campylobacter sp. MOP51]|uniref:GNAT family N-acetyltransferase n=1 Tax=Campylobacter canis TaxID=3378588 RepID=UPI003C602B59
MQEIKIVKVAKRDEDLLEKIFEIWSKSVGKTHLFLSEEEIKKIAEYVARALKEVQNLLVAVGTGSEPLGFAGINDNKLEMLFVAPENFKKGIGKSLLQVALKEYSVNEVCVNEQNPNARGFYEKMGFEVYRRTPFNEQGAPYPLLYMRLKALR